MILPNGRIKTKHPFAEVRLLDFQGSQAAANWTDNGSQGTASREDAPSYGLDSTNALKIVQANTGGSYRSRWNLYNAAGWDCSKSDQFTLAVEYAPGHLPSRQRVGSSGTVELTFSSNGAATFTNNELFILGGGGAHCGVPEVGRNVWTFNRSDRTSGTDNINWAGVTNVRLALNTASATDEIHILGLWCGRRALPAIAITFDDGWASQGLGASEACTIANSYGIPLTLYVIPALSDGSDGSTYLSAAEIEAIHAAGNAICVHGTGPLGVGDLTDYEDFGYAHVAAQQEWCRARGYEYQHYCYPGGAFNDGVLDVMRRLGMETARTLSGQSYTYQTWAAATAYAVGTYRAPTVPNGFRYSVESISGTGTSGGTEPVWPTTLGATVIDNAGANQITWKCRRFQTASRGSYYPFTPHIAGMPNWLSMNAMPLNNLLTLSQSLAELDKAIKKGEGILPYGHKLGAVADSLTYVTSDFDSYCAGVARRRDQGLCDPMTIPQLKAAYTRIGRPTGL